jgi:hypothetical protein
LIDSSRSIRCTALFSNNVGGDPSSALSRCRQERKVGFSRGTIPTKKFVVTPRWKTSASYLSRPCLHPPPITTGAIPSTFISFQEGKNIGEWNVADGVSSLLRSRFVVYNNVANDDSHDILSTRRPGPIGADGMSARALKEAINARYATSQPANKVFRQSLCSTNVRGVLPTLFFRQR